MRVADDVPLWSGRFDRQLEDVFAIQDEISRSIVNELRLKLGRGQRRYKHRHPDVRSVSESTRAAGASCREWPSAIELFDQVVKKDPTFAPAYAGIASITATCPMSFRSRVHSPCRRIKPTRIMRSAAFKALELDPLLADAHAAMGHVHAFDRASGPRRSVVPARAAAEPEPHDHVHRLRRSRRCFPRASWTRRCDCWKRRLARDPLSLDVRRVLVHVQINAGLYDRAIENCDRVLAVDPTFPFVAALRVRALLHKGRVDGGDCRGWSAQGAGAEGYLGYAYAVSGRRAEAEALAARNHDFPQRQAMIYAGLGDRDRRVRRAREACRHQSPAGGQPTSPVRSLPAFAAIRGWLPFARSSGSPRAEIPRPHLAVSFRSSTVRTRSVVLVAPILLQLSTRRANVMRPCRGTAHHRGKSSGRQDAMKKKILVGVSALMMPGLPVEGSPWSSRTFARVLAEAIAFQASRSNTRMFTV